MRKRHWLILILALLILSGCGTGPKEPEASPSPSVFYGEVPPGNPVGTEAMSTPPVTSTPEKAAETIQPTVQPQEAVNTEKENGNRSGKVSRFVHRLHAVLLCSLLFLPTVLPEQRKRR